MPISTLRLLVWLETLSHSKVTFIVAFSPFQAFLVTSGICLPFVLVPSYRTEENTDERLVDMLVKGSGTR